MDAWRDFRVGVAMGFLYFLFFGGADGVDSFFVMKYNGSLARLYMGMASVTGKNKERKEGNAGRFYTYLHVYGQG